MPERMRRGQDVRRRIQREDSLIADISAEYLGGSAKGSPVNIDCEFTSGTPNPKDTTPIPSPLEESDATKSAKSNGRATPLNPEGETTYNCGWAKPRLTDASSDGRCRRPEAGSGRTTRARALCPDSPGGPPVGCCGEQRQTGKGRKGTFDVVALDKFGKPKATENPLNSPYFESKNNTPGVMMKMKVAGPTITARVLSKKARRNSPPAKTSTRRPLTSRKCAFMIRVESGRLDRARD